MLYRVFPYDPGASPEDDGGPLFVPRIYQGHSRHDNPHAYGALYASRRAESAVAELLQAFRDRPVTSARLRSPGGDPYALAAIDDDRVDALIDLDDPRALDARGLRPSGVATRDRETTQAIALGIYEEGAAGLQWWSTLEASWINVTLFAERAARTLSLDAAPEPLTLDHPAVLDAAEALGLVIAA